MIWVTRKREFIAATFNRFGSHPILTGLTRRLAAILKIPVSLRTFRQDVLPQYGLAIILNLAIKRTTTVFNHLGLRLSEPFRSGLRFWCQLLHRIGHSISYQVSHQGIACLSCTTGVCTSRLSG